MNCRYSENDIALYVEGDLGPAKACEIQAHVLICGPCRSLETSLRESQSMLKSLRQDTVSAAALSAVRTRVLAEISGRSRPLWGRWVYAMTGALFVVFLSVGLVWYRAKDTQTQQVVVGNPLPPPAAVPLTRGTMTVVPPPAVGPLSEVAKSNVNEHVSVSVPLREGDGRRRRQGVAHTPNPIESPKPLMVKLLTDDPNIVIYWLVDQKTGGTL